MSQEAVLPDFNLNNPKNYLGYTVAVDIAASEPETNVTTLMEEQNADGNRISRDIDGSRTGARHLSLIIPRPERDKLTELGKRVVAVGKSEHGSSSAALDALRSLYGKRGKFIDEMPRWETITQEIMLNHAGIARLIALMQTIHADRGNRLPLPLPVLVQEVYHRDPEFARECLITSDEQERLQNIDWEAIGSDTIPDELLEKSLYRSSIVHQLKSILWHAGILTTKGRTRADLEFSADVDQFLWGLTPAFGKEIVSITWEDTGHREQPDIGEQVRDTQPPERVETTTSRIIRNTELVKRLKAEYDYCCQVCGDRRQQGAERYYAEGHHLHPLGEDGPDIRENIVIACPTCHADFDYGMMSFEPDTLVISHQYDDEIDGRKLTVQESHTIGKDYLTYHNQEIVE